MIVEAGATVNPQIQLKIERVDGAIAAVTVRAPVKGEGLRVTRVERGQEPGVFRALMMQAATGSLSSLDLSAADRSRLTELGVFVSDGQKSASVSFSCDLERLPRELVPARARVTPASVDACADVVANPTLRHLGRDGPTAEMRGRLTLPNPFRPDRSWLTIVDETTDTPSFYSYSAESMPAVAALRPGEPVPDGLFPDIRQPLFEARVIGSRNESAAQRDAWRQRRIAASKALRDDRYVVLEGMLAPLQLAAIRQYYRSLIGEGFLQYGDADWPHRYFSGRDSIGYFYQHQLAGLVSAIAGEPVKASFSFFASYHPGSTLPAHRDRAQCAYALSFLIDQSPEPAHTSPWPLYLQPPGADTPTPIYSGIGDGTLYYGCEVRHHREALQPAEADYCSYWFLFYVPESFDGPLD